MGKTWLRRSVQAGVCRVLVTCEVCGTIHQGYWRLSGHSQNQKIHKQTCWKPTNKVQRPEIKNLFQINLLKPRPLCFVTHKSSPSCSFQVVGDGEISASARWRWLDGNKIPPTILVVKTPTNPIPTMASKKAKERESDEKLAITVVIAELDRSTMGSYVGFVGVLIWELSWQVVVPVMWNTPGLHTHQLALIASIMFSDFLVFFVLYRSSSR